MTADLVKVCFKSTLFLTFRKYPNQISTFGHFRHRVTKLHHLFLNKPLKIGQRCTECGILKSYSTSGHKVLTPDLL